MTLNCKSTFCIREENNYLYTDGGMSAEICFTKYIAYKTGKQFAMWNPREVSIDDNPNIIVNTVNEICQTVRVVSEKEKTCVISAGVVSVPYLIELMDTMYLPSQLLVCVRSMEKLKRIIDNANDSGIECYAELGLDGCLPDCMVAWVKFTKIPPPYMNLLKELRVESLIMLGVNKGVVGGENIARLYEGRNCDEPLNRSIALLYINEGYGKSKTDEEEYFCSLVSDFDKEKIGDRVYYVHDWESALVFNPEKFAENFIGDKHVIGSCDSLHIYDLSWHVSREFMRINDIKPKGIVLNPYFINNPLFEVNHGFIAYSYWQFYPNAYNHYKTLIGDYEPPEIWANLIYNDTELVEKLRDSITFKMLSQHELARFVKNRRPYRYSYYMKPIEMPFLLDMCRKSGMDVAELKKPEIQKPKKLFYTGSFRPITV